MTIQPTDLVIYESERMTDEANGGGRPTGRVIPDNTRGRMGRRRPYIFWGGVLLLGAMALLWLPVSFESEMVLPVAALIM